MDNEPAHDSGDARPILTRFGTGTARLTLNNPRRKNAISLDMAARIVDFCDEVERDDTIGAVVVDAVGDYFCSGADTRDLAASSANASSPEAVARTSAIYESFVRVGTLPVPSISVVTGGAVGAGLNLALATDLMIVTPDAELDSGFLARGIHPGGGHLSLLGRAVGWSETIAMAGFGRSLTGKEAADRGLAYACAAAADVAALVDQLVVAATADPELTRRVLRSARLELGPPAISWSSALEVERGVQMWSMSRKGESSWSSRGPKTE
ncbi:MAG: enoyl-CoA hydratase [Gordonia sp.]|uniref:Enoyl-CoA hydratase-related protein n=1 Tax=Gordonia rubripertincta TaxID=36822 RepID=A0ABT4MRE6_GORRU|nr:enoyl-CoA hydratase-related protein [Gordonia rubripertincta]MBA4024065.1 enoyl-CoA hydratase [Gordonia sp. (in: high G+C Gram-positive bacteria)]MCZ4548866.1 enoyl-CoA hydratase-related protein [Gordonia rubripertincta]